MLLGAGGGRALTVRSLCREAGLSAKYFYESFTDRDEFVGGLYDAVVAELAATVAEAAGEDAGSRAPHVAVGDRSAESTLEGGDDARRLLIVVFEAAVGFFRADPRRTRILLTEPLVDTELRHRARNTYPAFISSLAPAAGISFDTAGDLQESLPLAALGGALLLTFVTWLDGDTGTSESELALFCADLVLSSPGVRSAGRGSGTGFEPGL